MGSLGAVSAFMQAHYKHFNSATLLDAARAYELHLASGKQMLLAIAGAMSTAELGISLAEMIRQDKVHFISCTGNNLEEDIMNLVAHSKYKRIPNYRDLTPKDEWDLLQAGLNRVTDTCIPEEEAFRKIQRHIEALWRRASQANMRYFPHEYMYQLLLEGHLRDDYEIDPRHSWVLAAAEKNLPMVVPGWEDSTMGNIFTANVMQRQVRVECMKGGIEYMMMLSEYYKNHCEGAEGMGFFQIGGGIAGDFPICSVPMMQQDLGWEKIPFWSYFCQISDSTTSYGSYSGAVPNEKITWGKLDINTPKFVIESDATIVAPLIFAWVLGW